jgi:hypothetical protein
MLAPAGAMAANEQVFVASGQPQDFTVPANTSEVTFTVQGAQGGSAQAAAGAEVVATEPATPGEVFELIVGGGGSFGFDPLMGAGFNGGGPAPAGYGSGGGGGASDVRSGACAATNSCGLNGRVIVAAGGGGADQCGYYDTGVGGKTGTVGDTQFDPPGDVRNYGFGGGGATQSAGGGGGTAGGGAGDPAAVSGGTGGLGQGGGAGAGGLTAPDSQGKQSTGCGGGGGGGGLYGGGGGGGGGAPTTAYTVPGGGGGGGSSLGPAGAVFTAGGGPYATSCDPTYGCLGANGDIVVRWGQQTTTTTLADSDSSPLTGETVTYTASVAAGFGLPQGTVDFKDGTTVVCSAVTLANGTAHCQQTYSTGSVQHAITAVYNGGSGFSGSTSNTVDVTAVTPTAVLQVSPSSYVFPNQSVGGLSTGVPFTVTNTGNAPTTIGPDATHQWGISGNQYLDFPTTGGTCQQGTVLAANGGSCIIGIVFDPTNTGFRQAFLNIEASDAADNIEVPLSGTATAAQITPTTQTESSFDNVQVGTTAPARVITISNPGNANLDLGALALGGTDPNDFSVGGDLCSHLTLTPGGSCTVDVSARRLSATLSVPNDAYTTQIGGNAVLTGTSVLTFNVEGTAPTINVTPTAPGFGDQLIDSPSASRQVTISNTGSAPLQLGTLSLAGANAGDFTQSSDTCSGTTVAVSGSCTIKLAFDPSATGARAATLEVPSDALSSGGTNVGVMNVALTGTGTLTPGHTLTVAIAGSGHGTVTGSSLSCPGTCSKLYADGTAVTLSATAAAGSSFTGWSGGGCSGTGTCSIKVGADQTVTATFTVGAGRTPAPACALKLGKTRSGKHGTQQIALIARCDQAATLKLTGRLTIVVHPITGHTHKLGLGLSAVTVAIRAGKSLTITVRVPKRALQAIGRRTHETIALTLVASNANGHVSTRVGLVLTGRRRWILSPSLG